jgi:hypothetical protein
MDASNTDAAVDRTAMQTHQAQLCRIGEAVGAAHHRRRLPIALQAHRNGHGSNALGFSIPPAPSMTWVENARSNPGIFNRH